MSAKRCFRRLTHSSSSRSSEASAPYPLGYIVRILRFAQRASNLRFKARFVPRGIGIPSKRKKPLKRKKIGVKNRRKLKITLDIRSELWYNIYKGIICNRHVDVIAFPKGRFR